MRIFKLGQPVFVTAALFAAFLIFSAEKSSGEKQNIVGAPTKMKTLLMAALAATLALGTAATAAEINPMPDFPKSIVLTGEINHGDDVKLSNVLQYRSSRGLTTEFLALHSPGGSLNAAYKMAFMVRAFGIQTVVRGDAECASACMLTFAAGVQRHAFVGADLGVHNANSGHDANQDGVNDEDGETTVMLARDMAKYGAPSSVVAKLVITPPDSMAWLDDSDVAGWVQIHDPTTAYVQPERPIPAAGAVERERQR